MIVFDHVTKVYGNKTAVQDFSLEIGEGEVWGLLGPNGSGKTTLIQILLGLLAPSQGNVTIENWPVRENWSRLASRVGAILETPRLYPFLNGREQLDYFSRLTGQGADRIDSALEEVGLDPDNPTPFSGYSLGMKQRLSIALVLLRDPKILIFDEPTNGLDPNGIIQIREIIQRQVELGKTIILCSHLISEVQQICNHVAILRQGNLLRRGAVRDLLFEKGEYRLAAPDNGRLAVALEKLAGEKPDQLEILRAEGDEGAPIQVKMKGDWSADELNRLLANEGVYVSELTPLRTSLEEFFLEAVG